MLLLQTGNCPKCIMPFELSDTVQSTNVKCKKCGKELIVCLKCKEKGCDCTGKLLNAWDKNPNFLN